MRYFILDVFTSQPLKGNPLAVVPDADGLANETMLAVAREFNLSETTFIMKPAAAKAARRVRIFTPALELPLAGHPVIGTWYLLAAEKMVTTVEGWNTFNQEVLAGILPVEILVERGMVSQVRMTQAKPQYFEEIAGASLAQALGISSSDLDTSLSPRFVSTGMKQLMVPVRSREVLRRIRPAFSDLERLLSEHDSHLAYVFSEENGIHYARSFFAAGSFVAEDPATGSAAGALGAYLYTQRGLTALQVSQGTEMGRGATIHVEIDPSGDIVKVGGTAVVVARGEFSLA
jgi:trans-2,3-dihydro-3-hydroxyanthranilate isomerase